MNAPTNSPLHWHGTPLRAVLFDLDGTLLDTAGDIALALRRSFADRGLAGPDDAAVRQMIGRGAPMLVERATTALGVATDAASRAELLDGFFAHYGRLQDEAEAEAQPYPGAREALAALHATGVPLAIVTNKQQRFALALLRRLDLARYVREVVGGDSCERRKPDPLPLRFACSQLGTTPAFALMVGDSVNDVEAARAAPMPVICVPHGYNEGRDPRTLPADAFVDRLDELPALLARR